MACFFPKLMFHLSKLPCTREAKQFSVMEKLKDEEVSGLSESQSGSIRCLIYKGCLAQPPSLKSSTMQGGKGELEIFLLRKGYDWYDWEINCEDLIHTKIAAKKNKTNPNHTGLFIPWHQKALPLKHKTDCFQYESFGKEFLGPH